MLRPKITVTCSVIKLSTYIFGFKAELETKDADSRVPRKRLGDVETKNTTNTLLSIGED